MKNYDELIVKYNRPAPRYTSYPPVPYWNEAPSEEKWISHIKENYNPIKGIDLYVHVPFCESLCYYCGCNRTITKNHNVEKTFLNLLLKEWDLYKSKLGFIPKINSLHLGGGTPTFLSAENLRKLFSELLTNKAGHFIGSIEIDPRTMKSEQLVVLDEFKIRRFSLGIQDFDIEVQRAIHRTQSPELVEKIVDEIRSYNIDSLNFDLIYGLPKQTVESIRETFKVVREMRPSMIAFYSYAHLPEKIKNQRLIKTKELPDAKTKRELYLAGKELLEEMGYVEIGMDHFALPESPLYQAMKEKKLHRNFMGYVDKKSDVLIGLGPTSISDSSESFVQNAKDLHNYSEKIQKGELAIESGHIHSPDDILVQKLMQELMCQQEMDLSHKQQIPYWKEIVSELVDFEQDGVVQLTTRKLKIKDEGRAFLRNVALCFDFHLREKKIGTKFSQSI